jgi:hypothetical protein
MESVLEVFSVERSVEFCNQDEGLILEGLRGGTSNMLATIESDVRERFTRFRLLFFFSQKISLLYVYCKYGIVLQ